MPIDPAVLAALPALRTVPPAALGALAERAVERRYDAGATIFAAGGEPRGLHLVVEGRVRVLRGGGGRPHVIHAAGPGDTLGDVPLFAGGSYPATAVAAEPVRCLLLDHAAISAAIAADPAFAFLLLGRLAGRVRELVDRLDARAARSATERLAEYLLARPRTATVPPRISLGMTQTALAEELGTVREVVVRALLALRRRALIAPLGGGRYAILDEAGLKAVTRDA